MSESDTIRETAEAIIEKLPDSGTFSHRVYHYQTDWDDTEIASYADLKALARAYLEQVENQQRTREYLRPYIDNVRLDYPEPPTVERLQEARKRLRSTVEEAEK